MNASPYTIHIYVPNGDPEDVKVISKMNWTGKGLVFPRSSLQQVARQRSEELSRSGVYILSGFPSDEDSLPKIYCGQSSDIKTRLDQHDKNPNLDFWFSTYVFVSDNDGLNRAHTTWIEYELLRLAREYDQVKSNKVDPKEPNLNESEKADTKAFLQEMLQIMPLVNLNAFKAPRRIVAGNKPETLDTLDTLVVPAKKEGFDKLFLGESAWYAVRIAESKLRQIKYIAVYQSSPISAITHYAQIKEIVSHGNEGKYKLVFSEPATELTRHIKGGQIKGDQIQSTMYASFQKLKSAKTVRELQSSAPNA